MIFIIYQRGINPIAGEADPNYLTEYRVAQLSDRNTAIFRSMFTACFTGVYSKFGVIKV